MKLAWVIGAGGMLGSALERSLARGGVRRFVAAQRIAWDSDDQASMQLDAATTAFAAAVALAGAQWQIYWAAGVGTMGSPRGALARETRLFERLLASIGSQPALAHAQGTLLLASSAGAIYAGSSAEVVTEATAIAPTTDYAHQKLEQEQLLAGFVAARPACAALVARITTLYGPQAVAGKRQGLIAEMARRIVRNQAVNIYVPLDTIRDYLAVDDAADALAASVQSISGRAGVLTRIFASGQATTISEITAIFRKVAHRRPLIISSGSTLTQLYKRRIQFRSLQPPIETGRPPTSLVVGIARVLAAERLAFAVHGD